MKANVVNEKTEISCIPLGLVLPTTEYPDVKLKVHGPVLEHAVKFDPRRYIGARRSFFDVWVIGGPRMPMLLFVLQLDDARLSWLADPTEPAVWRALDAWRRDGAVPVALSRDETHMFVIPFRPTLDENVNLLRRLNNVPASGVFVEQAIEVFHAGMLDRYEHPQLPPAKHTSACLLHTAGVAKVLERQGYKVELVTKAPRLRASRSTQRGAAVDTAAVSGAVH
ncbi:hypothetical protein [Paraburkholderia fungorum]|jgi:hypothetical protein|uniref:hypothetical protein n=1 Tax=Paraburkholderia fungorum TaxID=134537 RepID=UPI0004185F7D|nr:hypothetical protein [Paraburkholderia fungorum]PZR48599.1 MAG: hypothetical protein DI523_10550 [Paraburkholderia fungorum]